MKCEVKTRVCKKRLSVNSMLEDSDQIDKDFIQDSGSTSSPCVKVVPGTAGSTTEEGPLPQSDLFDSKTRKPRNFLIPSILVSILCFWPLGFAAIWQSAKSQRAVKRGEYANAKTHSNMAKSFMAFSVALGILQAVVMVTVVLLQLYVFPRYSYVPEETIATKIHQ